MTVGFIQLRDLNDGRFCWFTKSRWSDLLGYEISMTVGFAGLRDFNGDLNNGWFCRVTSPQLHSALFGYEISMTVGFAGLRDLNDGRFYSVTRSQ
ncbi:hypothetical protein DPX16_10040 [Anabarilius grahami]|uniref:Uncharacterized protein n=1 Tax=Anabarilius grahami TaxID=495550 RepID=A0A3N0XYN6_ANAGA|nr:hypothetical protein DPX16_10040 [Anabarilius grahami]